MRFLIYQRGCCTRTYFGDCGLGKDVQIGSFHGRKQVALVGVPTSTLMDGALSRHERLGALSGLPAVEIGRRVFQDGAGVDEGPHQRRFRGVDLRQFHRRRRTLPEERVHVRASAIAGIAICWNESKLLNGLQTQFVQEIYTCVNCDRI